MALVHSSALWKAEEEAPGTTSRDEASSERPESGSRREASNERAAGSGGKPTEDDNRGMSSRGGGFWSGEGLRGHDTVTGSGRGGRGIQAGRGQGRRSPRGRGSQPGRDEPGRNESGINDSGRNEPSRHQSNRNEPGRNQPARTERQEGWDDRGSRGGAAKWNRGSGRQAVGETSGRGGQPGSQGRGRGSTRGRRSSGGRSDGQEAVDEEVDGLSDRMRNVGSSEASILGGPPGLRGDMKGHHPKDGLGTVGRIESPEMAGNGLLGAAPASYASRKDAEAINAGLQNVETRQNDRGRPDRNPQQRPRNQGRPSGRGRGSTMSAGIGQPPDGGGGI